MLLNEDGHLHGHHMASYMASLKDSYMNYEIHQSSHYCLWILVTLVILILVTLVILILVTLVILILVTLVILILVIPHCL
jgi:hypothetical protein